MFRIYTIFHGVRLQKFPSMNQAAEKKLDSVIFLFRRLLSLLCCMYFPISRPRYAIMRTFRYIKHPAVAKSGASKTGHSIQVCCYAENPYQCVEIVMFFC